MLMKEPHLGLTQGWAKSGPLRPFAHEVVFTIQSLYRYVIRNVIALMKRWPEGPKFLQTGPRAKKIAHPWSNPIKIA